MTADVILKVGRPEFEFLLWHFLSVTLNTLPSLYPFFSTLTWESSENLSHGVAMIK